MSIDIDWKQLTTGPDGLALAETIREFIHDKFQQVALPRFIRSVEVHSFEFGEECPVVELKDVCDPLPDFYEDESEDGDGGDEEQNGHMTVDHGTVAIGMAGAAPQESLRQRRESSHKRHQLPHGWGPTVDPPPVPPIDTRLPGIRSSLSVADHIAGPLFPRSTTPGIPGGTSNLSYFHLPLAAGLSGSQTPLAAVSAGFQDHHAYPWENHPRYSSPQRQTRTPDLDFAYNDPSTRPSTAHSHAHHNKGSAREPSLDGTADAHNSETPHHDPDPSDLQVVLHIAYTGSIRLSLTAEILLDYPMPSFVGIPLKLNITGLSFDGVALIAYLRKRAHFCFLGPEDAEVLIGAESAIRDREVGAGVSQKKDKLGGLLREIRVESEIGQKESGKQVLKNVGKVEKFVLEQVRRIFEDEFVYPSFWTFLV